MICPKCGGKVRIPDVRNEETANDVLRKRKCLECGHIFYTVETIVEFEGKFKLQWRLNDRNKTYKRRKENV